MPVLEAMAVGLPCVFTAHGPTDEYTTTDFSKRIASRQVQLVDPDKKEGYERAWMLEVSIDSIHQALVEAIVDDEWRGAAATAAANFLHESSRGYTIQAITKRLLAVMFEQPSAKPQGESGKDRQEKSRNGRPRKPLENLEL